MTGSTSNFDLEEQITNIRRSLAETGKFQAETDKLLEGSRKYRRERWTAAVAVMNAVFALLGAFGGAAFYRLLG